MALALPDRYQIEQNPPHIVIFDRRLLDKCPVELFSADYWQAQARVIGQAQGRGTTWFVRHPGKQHELKLCLRHYRRGGLIGKLVSDQYLYRGVKATRLAQEFSLLAHMHEQGLPVPRPVAGLVARHGMTYRADLLIETIPGASDLVGLLSQGKLAQDTWHEIGQLVARFHRAGIWHADLNAHNILRDDSGKLWLIDFDRGEQRQPAKRWQQANLERLLRSFNKEQGRLPEFHFDQQRDWPALMAGYHTTPPQGESG